MKMKREDCDYKLENASGTVSAIGKCRITVTHGPTKLTVTMEGYSKSLLVCNAFNELEKQVKQWMLGITTAPLVTRLYPTITVPKPILRDAPIIAPSDIYRWR